jgi:metallo-beta-lactamase class B
VVGATAAVSILASAVWAWGYPAPSGTDSPGPIVPLLPPAGIPGTATATGSLPKEALRAVIQNHIGDIRDCYERELGADPAQFGEVKVQFTIAATGQVIASVVQKSTLGNPRVETCAVKAVRGWQFPKPVGGGIVVVSYPFVLMPDRPIVLLAGTAGQNRVELEPIGSQIIVHRSTDAAGIPANGLIVITDRGLLLVDTGWTEAQTAAILRWGDDRRKQPWVGALITHDHADRDGGLDALLRRGIKVSALDLTITKLKRRNVKGVVELFSAREIAVKDELVFEAFYPGWGHASDNIVVRFQSVLFGGCLIKSTEAQDLGFTGDANLESWPAAVRRVKERYGPTTIVPGHGPVDYDGAAYDHTLQLLEKRR